MGMMTAQTGPSAILARANGLTETTAVRWTERTLLSRLRWMFYPNDVAPQSSFSGVVVLHAEDIVRGQLLVLAVTLAKEEYRFSFNVDR